MNFVSLFSMLYFCSRMNDSSFNYFGVSWHLIIWYANAISCFDSDVQLSLQPNHLRLDEQQVSYSSPTVITSSIHFYSRKTLKFSAASLPTFIAKHESFIREFEESRQEMPFYSWRDY